MASSGVGAASWACCCPHPLLKTETSTQLQKYPGDLWCRVITANSISGAAVHHSTHWGCGIKATCPQPQFYIKSSAGQATQTIGSWLERDLPPPSAGTGAPSRRALHPCCEIQERFVPPPLPFDSQAASLFLALINIGVSGNCHWLGAYVLVLPGSVPCTYMLFASWGFAFLSSLWLPSG